MALTTLTNQSIANLTDFNIGTDDLPAGTILQVQQVYSPITFNQNSSSFADTGVSVSITPSRSNSKILIQTSGVCGSAYTNNFGRGRIYRNGAGIGYFFFLGGNFAATFGNRTTEEWYHELIDEPGNTNTQTYNLYMSVLDGNNMWIGRWGQDANWEQRTTITVFEIAG